MKGLLYKDLCLIRRSLLLGAAMVLFLGAGLAAGFGGARLGSGLRPGRLVPLLATVLSIAVGGMLEAGTIRLDHAARWDKLAAALPLSRRDIVAEKYIAYALLCLAGAAAGFAVSAVSALTAASAPFSPSGWASSFLLAFLVGTAAALLAGSLLLPGFLLLAPEKGDLVLLGAYGAACAALFGLSRLFGLFCSYQTHALQFGCAAIIFGALCGVLSFLLTARAYEARDCA